MAARLTDRKKKKIVADYLELQSYRATARKNNVSGDTVKRVVEKCGDFKQKAAQKKEENTADILAYMESQREDVCKFLEQAMGELRNPEKLAKAQLQQIATTMAIIIDKYTAISGGPADTAEEDDLSRSLRELGKELESDGES